MDLNLLTIFEAVARTSSFSAAARELGMPKSSASRGVARLENELGVQLLFRTTRQVSLSAAGTALYDRVTPLLRSVKAVLGEVPEREEAPSGTLRVTAPVDLGVLFLAAVATRYTARHPAVSLDLHLTGRVVDLVGEGFDVALRVAPKLTDSTLVVRRAAPILLRLYASPLYLARRGTPRSEADLDAHEWVVFRGGPQQLRVTAPRPAPGRAARIVCDDLLFVRDAVRAGAGVGLLPTFVAEPDLVAGQLVRVVPRYERAAGSLFLVTPAAKHVAPKVTAFRDLVLEMLAARAPAGAAL
ncbi:LysR family transcriptional regulator [Anaeromyxobacter diazotrophicus]|uniref:Transcriptional regulator n=1 Tax=Anaeromyxobacter diazotrophicus TaxID=2590199 RepID=A0A7I9VHW9_9BACT|nr:LysR family transcriptional regulator [Anaeromyxobacter diazotrophicus]GEJ56003.1 transcriptional regulator [Anaeromyxobacter diazotrophicus]